MLKITESNYEYYTKIYSVIWNFYEKHFIEKDLLKTLKPEQYPLQVLKRFEKESMVLARSGLKTGLLDSLTEMKDWPIEYISFLNHELEKENLPNIQKLTATVREIPEKVLKRGTIKNLDEYYVIKEVLLDTSYDIDPQSRSSLTEIFMSFEKSKK